MELFSIIASPYKVISKSDLGAGVLAL